MSKRAAAWAAEALETAVIEARMEHTIADWRRRARALILEGVAIGAFVARHAGGDDDNATASHVGEAFFELATSAAELRAPTRERAPAWRSPSPVSPFGADGAGLTTDEFAAQTQAARVRAAAELDAHPLGVVGVAAMKRKQMNWRVGDPCEIAYDVNDAMRVPGRKQMVDVAGEPLVAWYCGSVTAVDPATGAVVGAMRDGVRHDEDALQRRMRASGSLRVRRPTKTTAATLRVGQLVEVRYEDEPWLCWSWWPAIVRAVPADGSGHVDVVFLDHGEPRPLRVVPRAWVRSRNE